MEFRRSIEVQLNEWKGSPSRKPLILRGARQVGKTTVIMNFAKSYKHKILLNLEKSSDISYFKDFDDVKNIIDALFLFHRISSIDLTNTLLFIDEIQESPKAIQLLRYFYEEYPKLHVIAAGSLLEFAMRKVKSFPVGRVEYLYLYPLNFQEYLEGIGHKELLNELHAIPVKPVANKIFYELFNKYAIIGGMPEVISNYIVTEKLSDLPLVYESIWGTYKYDVEKYAENDTERRVIKHIINTAHLYIDQRIKFQNFGNSNYRSREVGEAMRNLDDAKIIQLIYPTTDLEPPVKADLKKSPRLQFLDTGLVNYTNGLQGEMLSIKDLSTAYKGAIIPHLITQELISLNKISSPKPNFWVREKNQASSEVDLVFAHKSMVIPIEIKSGKVGTLKSLHQYIDSVDHNYAIRIYGGEYLVEQTKTPKGKPYFLMNLPYYLGTKIPDYVEYLVSNYKL